VVDALPLIHPTIIQKIMWSGCQACVFSTAITGLSHFN